MAFTKIESKTCKKTSKICVIDGIKFDCPESFEDYFLIGALGLLLLITLPIWIWFYLFGKFIIFISQKKTVTKEYKQLICPVCKSKCIKGDYKKIKCASCGFYDYYDSD